MKKTLQYLVITIFILSGIFIGIWINFPPQAPQNTSDGFSAAAAREDINQIAAAPHPIGTAEHTRVRETIVAKLVALGLEAEVQNSVMVWPQSGDIFRAAVVNNIIARQYGSDNSKAILLMTHYDTVPNAPGANDDSAGVAVILETMRILTKETRLKNDIIILITDGEEIGLAGAEVFFRDHPWAEDIGVVLNLESRGCSGGVFMFETGPDNAWLIKDWKNAAAAPIGNSISNAIYQLMPNDTDFTVSKRKKLPGLNFAHIDGWFAYHTPLDNIDHLDKNTLAQYGSNVLTVTRALGNRSLNNLAPGDAIYFQLWRSWIITYSSFLTWFFIAGVVGLLLITIFVGFHNKRLSGKGLLLGFLAPIFYTGIGIVIIALLLKVIKWCLGGSLAEKSLYPDYRNIFLPAFSLIILALFFLTHRLLSRWVNIPSLSLGALGWWLAGTIGLKVLLPGGSFIFMWPLLFGLLSLWVVFYLERPEAASWARVILIGILLLPGLIIFSQLLFTVTLSFRLNSLLFIMVGILSGILVPSLAVMSRRAMGRYAAAALILSAAAFSYGLVTQKAIVRPAQESVYYLLDADRKTADLGIREKTAWTEKFLSVSEQKDLSGYFPYFRGKIFSSPAEAFPCETPQVEVSDSSETAGNRTTVFTICSPSRAPLTVLLIESDDVLIRAEISGTSVANDRTPGKAQPGKFTGSFVLYAVPETGIDLKLVFSGTYPIKITAVDTNYELPSGLILPVPPEHTLPRIRSSVKKSFLFFE